MKKANKTPYRRLFSETLIILKTNEYIHYSADNRVYTNRSSKNRSFQY